MTPGPLGGAANAAEARTASPGVAREHAIPAIQLSKKQLKRLFDGGRPLDAWERYRALNDAIGEAYDLIDVNNREARFALIMLGGLNALLVFAASRSDLVASLEVPHRQWVGALLAGYAGVAVFFLLEAIKALRPGKFRPDLGDWSAQSDDYPKRVRYYEDVVTRDVHSHWRAWREVHVATQRRARHPAAQFVAEEPVHAYEPAPALHRPARHDAAGDRAVGTLRLQRLDITNSFSIRHTAGAAVASTASTASSAP
jgi:hypothetical protein